MIKTKRLTIRLASDREMRDLIYDEKNADLKKAYSEMLDKATKNPTIRQWYATWIIEEEGKRIGDLCFKGIADGVVEVGYGILPAYMGKGYATEAVNAVTEWALEAGAKKVEAEAEYGNIASKRVLEKAGFVPTGVNGDEGEMYVKVNAK